MKIDETDTTSHGMLVGGWEDFSRESDESREPLTPASGREEEIPFDYHAASHQGFIDMIMFDRISPSDEFIFLEDTVHYCGHSSEDIRMGNDQVHRLMV